ncbi:MAG: DUF3305 domain-containing protein [Methylocella sp.]
MSIPVGVIVERRKAKSPWLDFVWRPLLVLPGAPSAAPWTPISSEGEATTFYAGEALVELHRTETANYRDNIASRSPSLWVILRPTGGEPAFALLSVTADPAEGEALTSAGNDLVEAVAMPTVIRETVEAFIAKHHVEQSHFKRQRDRADPPTLGRGRNGPETET